MLVIRESQMKQIRVPFLLARVEEWIRGHASATLSASSVLDAATRFGLTSLPALRQFTALAIEEGLSDFEADPSRRWIVHALNDRDVTSPLARLERVRDLRLRRQATTALNDKAEQLFNARSSKAAREATA